MDREADIVIVGAGAAGLWAAAICARAGRSTLLLEKTPRAGTKILASGGTRCNLTTTLDSRAAALLFGKAAARFLAPAFAALSPQAVRDRFAALGVPTKTEPELEKVFPVSDSARSVRNALQHDAHQAGATLLTNHPVTAVVPVDGGWQVSTPQGEVRCRVVMLCCGGKSYPKTGTTGDGYGWLRALGLKVVDPVPALVPLVSSAEWATALTGVSLDAEVRIGTHRRRRPTLFTHHGLSGPGPMDLSVHVARHAGPVDMLVDLLPDHSWESLRELFLEAAGRKGAPHLIKLLPLQRRLIEAVALQAGLPSANPAARELSKSHRHRLVETLKGLPVPISGTMGFAKAEVTAGGLALPEVDRKTMAVRKHPGLYVFGELLDLTGPIGGLNFQAAFATAELAGLAAVKSVEGWTTARAT